MKICLFATIVLVLATIADSANVDITSASATSGIVLNCTGGSSDYYQWTYKNMVNVTTQLQNSTNSNYIVTNSKSVGTYNCLQSETVIASYNAINLTKPVIVHKGHSITLTKGDKNKTLVCKSYSYPKTNFTWLLNSGNVDKLLATHANYLITNGQGMSTLTIMDVKDNSRGDYVCRVQNPVGSKDSSKVLIRVHSPTAYLWPLIGIIAEIVVIICIILVVRRQTIAQQKEAAGQMPSATSVQPNSSAHPDLRNRNVQT